VNDRMMVFIDGSNLLRTIDGLTVRIHSEFNCKILRRYWFGSYQGDEQYELSLRRTLRGGKLEPIVFKKREKREKRVDIAIAREMLINATSGNYDLALLVAGDEDYVDLVHDLKRLGVRVIGSFYETGLSENLKLAFDHFHELHVWGHIDMRKKLVEALGGTLPK